jgi:cytoskeletal protein CcmA (bactofilin family)
MSDHIVEDGSFINSIVGEDTFFRGELNLSGLLRIDGDYSGVIRTTGKVLIGKNGRAECTIYAGTVVVGGVIKGNVHSSEKVIILSTGMVIGNIHTPRLIVEEGVILNGECKIDKEYRLDDESPKEEATEPDFRKPNHQEPESPEETETSHSRDNPGSEEENSVERKPYSDETFPDTSGNAVYGETDEKKDPDETALEEKKEISAWNG